MNSSCSDHDRINVDNLGSSDRVEEILENEPPFASPDIAVAEEEKICEESVQASETPVVEEAVEEPLAVEFEQPQLPKNLEAAMSAKEEGNKFYRDGEYDLALRAYTDAVDYCPMDNPTELVKNKLYYASSTISCFVV
jgi:hypothetical protein